MINKTGLILLIVLVSISVYPQIQTGLKGGYTLLSCADWNDYGTNTYTTPQPSYFFSVFERQRKPKIFNLGVELEYSHSFLHVNTKIGHDINSESYTLENFDLSADFLKIIFQPQFTFGTRVKFFIYPGVFLGFNIQTRIKGYLAYYQYDSLRYYSYTDGPVHGHLSDYETGFLLGAGTDIPLYHELTMVLEFMQTMTFPSIHNSWGYGTGIILFETRFSVGIAYNIPAKKKNNVESKY
jgi:hypothetical protein